MSGPARSKIYRYGIAVFTVVLALLATALFEICLGIGASLLPFTLAVLISGLFGGLGPGVAAIIMSVAAGGAFVTFQEAPLQKEDLPHWILFILSAAGILYACRAKELNHRKAVEARKALEFTEKELRTIIDILPLGIWFTDNKGKILSGNEAGKRMWGGIRYVGQDDYSVYRMWYPGTSRSIPLEEYPSVRALKGEEVINEMVDIMTLDEKRRTLLISAIPLRGEEGEVSGVLVVNEDITQRQAVIEELKRAKEAAEAGSRAKDRFLAVLSHELRTPLTPVLMLAEAFETSPSMPERLRADAAMIRRYVSLEARLIDDLLDLTRIEKGKLHIEKVSVDLNEILHSVVEMTQAEARRKGIGICTNLNATQSYIRGDRARIKQVIWNLLGNALKFTPPGGSVGILTEDVGNFIRITVSDTGIGLLSEALTSIFDAFEQADSDHRRFGGLGLGLAIAKSLVELHGGHISAGSPGVGKGSVFKVLLPVCTARDTPLPTPPSPKLEGGALRILLVEDHEPTAFVLSKLLKRRGHHVRMATSVQEAIAASHEAIDLLVSDIGLPDGTGWDVIRHYRSTQNGFKAIALSGFGMDNDLAKSKESGFNQHLTKPVDFDTLQEAISLLFQKKE